jgi:hypothetical protein
MRNRCAQRFDFGFWISDFGFCERLGAITLSREILDCGLRIAD